MIYLTGINSSQHINMPDDMPIAVTTVHKSFIAALRSLLGALHLVGIGLLLSGRDAKAASGVVASTKNFLLNAAIGYLLASTRILSLASKNRDRTNIAVAIKLSWLMGVIVSSVTIALFLMIKKIDEWLFESDTGHDAGYYFSAFALGVFAENMMSVNNMIFNVIGNDACSPLIINFAYRSTALTLSWLLANHMESPIVGAGVGATITGIAVWLTSLSLFFRQPYRSLSWGTFEVKNIKQHAWSFFSDGCQLSMQRNTEWINLMLITYAVGRQSNSDLIAMIVALFVHTLIGGILQGWAQGTMIFLKKDYDAGQQFLLNYQQSHQLSDLKKYHHLHKKNKKAFVNNNIAALGLTVGFVLLAYLCKKTLINLFLGHHVAEKQAELAEKLLLWMLINLIPDSLRVVSAAVLSGMDDMWQPSTISLLLMTIVGVPLGSYLPSTLPLPLKMLEVRAVMVICSAAINIKWVYQKFDQNELIVEQAIYPNSSFSKETTKLIGH